MRRGARGGSPLRREEGSPGIGNFGGSVQRAFAGKTSISLAYVPPPRQGPPPVISRPRGGRLGKCYNDSKPTFKSAIQRKGPQGGRYYVNGFDSHFENEQAQCGEGEEEGGGRSY